ncbi:MAG: OmpA family protein [Rhodobacteraceae bacterium]|nr:OmpA family protein [Paracoccaceae bacterium]
MAGSNSGAPVIIKRKKIIAGGGHHGGAWKVAYADFVTAMMAFFLLMWLLNATTENQRKGLADYFSPSVPVSRVSGGGDGAFGGDSVFADDTLAHSGRGVAVPGAADKAIADQGAGGGAMSAEEAALREVEAALLGRSGESMTTPNVLRHILTRVTDEGLIIELFDLDNAPLFVGDSAEPTQVVTDLTALLAEVFVLVRNEVAVNGHVRGYPVVLRDNPTWDLSTARAQQVRLLLEAAGLPPRRVQRVTGYADRKPAVATAAAARNNRLEVILLRHRK